MNCPYCNKELPMRKEYKRKDDTIQATIYECVECVMTYIVTYDKETFENLPDLRDIHES